MLSELYIFAVLIVIGIIYFKFFKNEKFTSSSASSSSASSSSASSSSASSSSASSSSSAELENIKKYIDDKFTELNIKNNKEIIIEEINKIYDIDVESIRNLSAISQSLLTGKNYHSISDEEVEVGTLKIPANVVIEGNLKVRENLKVIEEVEFENKDNKIMDILPSGMVIAWTKSTIPLGWAICNGQNGTPNLRKRFIIGEHTSYSSYRSGRTGGEERVTLSTSQIPSHRHHFEDKFYASSDSSSKDSWSKRYGGKNNHGDDSRADGDNYIWYRDSNTSYTGSSHSHNNMPPYYALKYIMKL
jgi:hypothetical protein